MNVLGLLYLKRDPAACLLDDGGIIAVAEEERFIREKHAIGKFPENAIKYCLGQGNLSLRDINAIAVGWDVSAYPQRMKKLFDATTKKYPEKDGRTRTWESSQLKAYSGDAFEKRIRENLLSCGYSKNDIPPIIFKPHHYCHAVSAYVASGFKDASVITMDGHGEMNSTVLWAVRDGLFKKLQEFNIPHSLGWYYAAFTRFTGFETYDGEGKTMGLAPYGRPNEKYRKAVRAMLKITEDGYEIDPTYLFYGKRTVASEFSDKFARIFGEMRENDKEEINDHHKDAAYEAQQRLEEVGLYLAEHLVKKTGIKNLCLAGGVALNCKMNGIIHRSGCIDNLFIQPMSSDEGTALGAAMSLYLERGADLSVFRMEHVYYGPEFTDAKIKSALENGRMCYAKVDNIEERVAGLLADGKVVGWFQGRMEVGPRALGNRSILADPRREEMKDVVNNMVKFREPWRPFCPSMLYEAANDYLIKPCYHPFMILTFLIKEDKKGIIPAVVHVDGTARVQTVKKEVNPRYWKLIDEFRKKTGVPVLLNTSFNIKGEPIVCTPENAVNSYITTGLDALAIGDYLVAKKI